MSEEADEQPLIVVLSLGSAYLRYGLSTDFAPQEIEAMIGYRSEAMEEDPGAVPNDILKARDVTLTEALRPFKVGKRKSAGKQGNLKPGFFDDVEVPAEIYDEENAVEDVFEASSSQDEVVEGAKVWFGDAILDGMMTYCPIRCGRFNVDSTRPVSHAISALSGLVEECFRRLVVKATDIGVALSVPDTFCRYEREEMYHIVMRLGVTRVMMHRQSVLAGFGVGVSTACVVDIGAQKTSVCCVDAGEEISGTRFCIPMGGDDLDELGAIVCAKLDKEHYFPGDSIGVGITRSRFLRALKEGTFGFADHNEIGSKEGLPMKSFQTVVKHAAGYKKVGMNLTTACAVVPIALFHPQLLAPTVQENYEFLAFVDNFMEPFNIDYDDDLVGEEFRRTNKLPEVIAHPSDVLVKNDAYQSLAMPSLDELVTMSIMNITDPELRKTMAKQLILTGATSKLHGLGDEVEEHLIELLPIHIGEVDLVDHLDTKPQDPAHLSWIGLSVVCGSDAASVCWLSRSEYDSYGTRSLRAKVPFSW